MLAGPVLLLRQWSLPMEIGVHTPPLADEPLERAPLPRRDRRRSDRAGRRRASRSGPHYAGRVSRQRDQTGRAPRPARGVRDADQRTRDPQQPAPSRRRAGRGNRYRTPRGDPPGRPARGRNRHLFLGTAGGESDRRDPELDHRTLAAPTRRSPRVPVGSGRSSTGARSPSTPTITGSTWRSRCTRTC